MQDRPEKLATLLNSTGEAPPTPHELAVGLRAAVEAYYKSWDWEVSTNPVKTILLTLRTIVMLANKAKLS
jgi:hypothetical protein